MRNSVVKVCTLFSLCSVLFLSAYASSIPAGTYSLTGVSAGTTALSGTITLNASGLATAASLVYGSTTFSTVSSTGTSGSNPAADFVYLSGSNGQAVIYYFTTLNPSGGINLCEAGSGCAQASYVHLYSPNYQAGLSGGSLTSGAASAAVTPELSTWVLLTTGLVMIAAVLILRRRPESGTVASSV